MHTSLSRSVICPWTSVYKCNLHRQLMIFIIVIQIEDWWTGPHQFVFWYDTDYRFVICSLYRLHCKVCVIPNEGLVGPANPSFGKTMRKILKDPFYSSQLMYLIMTRDTPTLVPTDLWFTDSFTMMLFHCHINPETKYTGHYRQLTRC